MKIKEWMPGCPDCRRVLAQYDLARIPADCYDARRAITAHLATVHYDKLPLPINCVKCADFRRVLGLPPGLLTPIIAKVLENVYVEHRADHLVVHVVSVYRELVA